MTAGRNSVLLLGGTGRTGLHVLAQLLDRGVEVRAIVRSRTRLPAQLVAHPGLTVSEADLLSLREDELRTHVRGCTAVVSCLGHTISLRGIFGPPRDLVTAATTRLCQAIRSFRPDRPVKFVLMSSVSVNHPQVHEPRRTALETLLLRVLRAIVPPANDNQRAADYLQRTVGTHDPYVEWVAVRPDTLLPGEPSPYVLHEGIVSSLFKPASTNMANVAAHVRPGAVRGDLERLGGDLPGYCERFAARGHPRTTIGAGEGCQPTDPVRKGTVDIPRIFNIAESAHRIHNPITPEKLATLGEALRLESGALVLDLGSGSGEMLCTWARDHGVTGVGIDMSESFTAQARLRAEELGVADRVTFIHGDAAGYVADEKVSVAACVGATWIAGGVAGTVELLARSLRAGGIILIGEPFWRQLPPTEAVARGCLASSVSDFRTLPELLASFGQLGYDVVEMVLADQDGWDRYEGAKWLTLRRWLDANPGDELAEEVRASLISEPARYAACTREYLGWGVFALMKR